MFNFQFSSWNQEKWSLQSAFSDPSWARSLRQHELSNTVGLSQTAIILHPPDWCGAFQTLPTSFPARLFSFSTGLPVSECLLTGSILVCFSLLFSLSPLPLLCFFSALDSTKTKTCSSLTFMLGGHPNQTPWLSAIFRALTHCWGGYSWQS